MMNLRKCWPNYFTGIFVACCCSSCRWTVICSRVKGIPVVKLWISFLKFGTWINYHLFSLFCIIFFHFNGYFLCFLFYAFKWINLFLLPFDDGVHVQALFLSFLKHCKFSWELRNWRGLCVGKKSRIWGSRILWIVFLKFGFYEFHWHLFPCNKKFKLISLVMYFMNCSFDI